MKNTISILLAVIMAAAVAALSVSAAGLGDATTNCGTWTYESGTLKGGAEANGDNLANTGIKIESGKHILVSVDVKADAFQGACGFGLHFSADPNGGVGNGQGVLTWTGDNGGFTQFKTWNWNANVLGTAPDYWDPIENLAWNDTTTVYTVAAEFFDDGTAQYSIKNNSTGAEHVLQGKALEFLFPESGCVYVNLIILNQAVSFSNLVVKDLSAPDTSDAAIATVIVSVALIATSVVISKKRK